MKSSMSTSGKGWATNVGVTPGASVVGGGGAEGPGVAVWSTLGRFLAIICFITSLKKKIDTNSNQQILWS